MPILNKPSPPYPVLTHLTQLFVYVRMCVGICVGCIPNPNNLVKSVKSVKIFCKQVQITNPCVHYRCLSRPSVTEQTVGHQHINLVQFMNHSLSVFIQLMQKTTMHHLHHHHHHHPNAQCFALETLSYHVQYLWPGHTASDKLVTLSQYLSSWRESSDLLAR